MMSSGKTAASVVLGNGCDSFVNSGFMTSDRHDWNGAPRYS